MKRYIIGIDIGQQVDPTAVAVVEKIVEEAKGNEMRKAQWFVDCEYHVVALERLPLGLPYPEQVRYLVGLTEELREKAPARVVDGVDRGSRCAIQLVVDSTGVGKPVVDSLKEELARVGLLGLVAEVVFTSGLDVSRKGGRFTVPKGDLICTLDLALQQRRVKVAGLDLAPTLFEELANLKRTLNERTGRDSYGNLHEGTHDDLAMALCVALWWGEAHPSLPAVSRTTVKMGM